MESECRDENEKKIAALAAISASYLLLIDDDDDEPPQRNFPSVWVRDWLKNRESDGVYHKLLQELRNGDCGEQDLFFDFTRMSYADFELLLQLVAPLIAISDTVMQRAITASERLALTLHYLSTGQSFHSLQYLFRLPQCTISKIIPPVLDAIWLVLKDEYVRVSFCIYIHKIWDDNSVSLCRPQQQKLNS